MKILQLATSIEGGAGRAVLRSHQALLENGFDSTLIYLKGKSTSPTEKLILFPRSKIDKIKSKAITLLQSRFVQLNNELISTFSLDVLHKKSELLSGYDVIHLHAMYNFVGSESLEILRKLNTPVVITMHDMRLATGGCHYSGECQAYKSNCENCPLVRSFAKDRVKRSKINQAVALKQLGNLTVITPSSWLREAVKELNEFKGARIIKVNNPVPGMYFSKNRKSERSIVKIGFIAANLNNPYKGLDTFVAAMNILFNKADFNFSVLFMGDGEISGIEKGLSWEKKSSRSDADVTEFYKEIDLLCVPSTEDNSPSVISEALASGVSVIGTEIGGIPEILTEFGMPTIKPQDAEALATAVSESLKHVTAIDQRELANEMFSYKSYTEALTKIYLSSRAQA